MPERGGKGKPGKGGVLEPGRRPAKARVWYPQSSSFPGLYEPAISLLKQKGLPAADQHGVADPAAAYPFRGGPASVEDPVDPKDPAVFPPDTAGADPALFIHVQIDGNISLAATGV